MNTPRAERTAVVRQALLALVLCAATAASAYIGRPVYSEPGAGIALPPGCSFEPSWRARLANSDLELWVVDCALLPHVWLVRRGVIAYDSSNRARLRFQILDDRKYPGETAGETVSVQCTARGGSETGFAVIGANWRSAQGVLRLGSAKTALAVDRRTGKLVELPIEKIDCSRFLDREEMMRQLQQKGRGKP
jgi:hypothetical protein